MDDKAREVLRQIEDILMAGGTAATDLWDIMAALRGPDNEAVPAKNATIFIRRQAFPRLTEQIGYGHASFADAPMFRPDPEWKRGGDPRRWKNVNALIVVRADEAGDHFQHHVRRALEALEIDELPKTL